MCKLIFYISSFLIIQFLFVSDKTNDTFSIFGQNMTSKIEQLNTTETFLTKTKPYLQVISPNNSTVKALMTFNDILPNGLAAIQNKDGLIDIFVNHELSLDEVNEYAKVSKLTVDKNGRIVFGELI